MADLNRPDYGQVWASTGEKVAPDTVKMQSGWVQEMMPFQYENYLQARQDEAIVYLLQKGVPEYSPTQEYIANKSVVVYQGNLYMATATVTNVLPTVTASWKRLNPSLLASGAVPVSSGGTGATTASEARTNLGLGSIATSVAPSTNGIVVKDANDSLVARTITGTSGNVVITNPDGVAGNINVNVGSNVAQLSQDSSWTSKGGIRIPSGSTGERGLEVAGKIRYNTTLQKFEGFDGVSWNALGASSNVEITTLSGNGATTTFTLNTDVFSAAATDVYIGGIYQNKASYSVSGSTITFSEAPVAGVDNIQILSRRVVDLGLSTATQVSIQDTTNLYTSSTVEGALREVGDKVKFVKNAILSFPDYAVASAAAATLPDGQRVVDSGTKLEYIVQSGSLSKAAPFLPSAGVARVADLLQVSPDRAAIAAHVRGYHLGGLGGGNYVWDAAKAKSAHDGGAVISPTVPWDGSLGTLSAFLSGTGEASPAGTGCWVRVSDGKETVACWGAVGNDAQDDTASVIKAKVWFDSKSRPTVFPTGFKCLLTSNLVFSVNYTGIVFEGSFQPYSYTTWATATQGLRFDLPDVAGQAAIKIDGLLGPVLSGFFVSAPLTTQGFAFDIRAYSGLFERVRLSGFHGSVAFHGSNSGVGVQEPIFNRFDNFDCYSLRYGFVSGRDSSLVEQDGAANENTFINCRFRGNRHALWITKTGTESSPHVSYGTVFINLILQETSRIDSADSDPYYDIVKIEGGAVRGITFIGGRIETYLEAGRKPPRIDVSGMEPSKPLFFVNGTYIHNSIVIYDPNNVWGGTGDVYDPTARFPRIQAKTRVETPVLRSPDGAPLEIQFSTTSNVDGFKFSTSDTETTATLNSRYATSASPIPQKIVSYEFRYRDGNVWRADKLQGRVFDGAQGIFVNIAGTPTAAFTAAAFRPVTSVTYDLGTSAAQWRSGYFSTSIVVGGNKVLGTRQTAIANATTGTEVTTINSILAAMRAHGLIAT